MGGATGPSMTGAGPHLDTGAGSAAGSRAGVELQGRRGWLTRVDLLCVCVQG